MNNKMRSEEQGNAIGKPFNLETNFFPSRKIFCQCDSCRMNFNYISELIINKKNYLGKKTDKCNACRELLFNTIHETTHTREKNEFFKSGKTYSHSEDPLQHEKIQTLEQNFEYNMDQETFLEKAIFNTHRRERTEGNKEWTEKQPGMKSHACPREFGTQSSSKL